MRKYEVILDVSYLFTLEAEDEDDAADKALDVFNDPATALGTHVIRIDVADTPDLLEDEDEDENENENENENEDEENPTASRIVTQADLEGAMQPQPRP